MPPAPEGAQLSDDGNYWWDGQQWQPVDGGGGQSYNIDLTSYPNLNLMMQCADLETLVSSLGVDASSLTDESEDVA